MNKERIGIQFNSVEEKSIIIGDAFKSMGFEGKSDHVDIFFSRKELKKMDDKMGDYKSRYAFSLLRKHLENSDYTNIYTYIDADKLSTNVRKYLLDRISDKSRMRIEEIVDNQSFIQHFEKRIEHQSVINLVKKNPRVKFMDKILKELAKRDFAQEQKMVLELSFEDKAEWGADEDNLVVSIQLDIPEI